MIKITNLDFSFYNKKVIDNLSLDIHRGDYIAIIGANGSGKTTLVKCILGMNKVSCSSILIDGICINKFKKFKQIGYVSQYKIKESDLPITGLEYLSLITSDQNKRDKWIEKLQLTEFINLDINKLSGGQKQRIMIAKALLHEIDYLILDEPSVGLDLESRKNLYDLLGALNKEGLTIIIISHHIDEISCQINKVFEMENNVLEEIERDNCKYC